MQPRNYQIYKLVNWKSGMAI